MWLVKEIEKVQRTLDKPEIVWTQHKITESKKHLCKEHCEITKDTRPTAKEHFLQGESLVVKRVSV